MAHAWNACWVHALVGSNPTTSAADPSSGGVFCVAAAETHCVCRERLFCTRKTSVSRQNQCVSPKQGRRLGISRAERHRSRRKRQKTTAGITRFRRDRDFSRGRWITIGAGSASYVGSALRSGDDLRGSARDIGALRASLVDLYEWKTVVWLFACRLSGLLSRGKRTPQRLVPW